MSERNQDHGDPFQNQSPAGIQCPRRSRLSLRTKKALRRLGYYDTSDYGLTPYPDQPLFDGLSRFQSDNALHRTGEMRPGDETERSISLALHKSASTGARTGTYIWRTRGDSEARSEHAARDGRVFSWDDPPEGGHPGEAPNCKCVAEAINCNREELKLVKARDVFFEVDGKLTTVSAKVHNKRLEVERHEADKEFYHHVNRVAQAGGTLTMAPHPLGRFAGWVFQIGEKISSSVLHDIEVELKRSKTALAKLETRSRALQVEWSRREAERDDASRRLEACRLGK